MVIITFKIVVFQGNKLEKKKNCSRCLHGNGSGYGCDLVKWMQPGGNCQTAWIMFDHVKRVEGWMTLA
jgi:hypothetical protein